MLDLLSSEAICKSFLPLKIIFSGGGVILFSSLESSSLGAAVAFCCYKQEVVLVLLRHGFVKSRPCFPLKCTRKLSVTSWISVVQKTTAATSEGCLWSRRTPDALHDVPQAYPNTVGHPPSSQSRSAARPCDACVHSCTLRFCVYLCQLEHKNTGFVI